MEVSQHAKYTCTFCGKNTVKRHSVGIWSCKSCKKTTAGGAYTVSYVIRTRAPVLAARLRLIQAADPGLGLLLLSPCGRHCEDYGTLRRSSCRASVGLEGGLPLHCIQGQHGVSENGVPSALQHAMDDEPDSQTDMAVTNLAVHAMR